MIKKQLKKWFFPGMNLHARQRFNWVPQQFGEEIGKGSKVLDAGCGNGMLSYRAWQRGAHVLGISIKDDEVQSCRAVFNQDRGINGDELKFENINLYDLDPKDRQFDAIICAEVLEHIVQHDRVCAKFFQLLRPGGVLHVTTPNAEHPYNIAFPIDTEEKGGHVRPGYTEQDYRDLMEPIGFRIEEVKGLGGPIRQGFDNLIKSVQESVSPYAGIPFFAMSLPFTIFDPASPKVPFCLYVKARKPADG